MTNIGRCLAVLVLSLASLAGTVVAAEKAPPFARMGGDAAVRLDGDDVRLQFVLLTSSGSVLETLNEQAEGIASDVSLSYRFVRSCKEAVAAGRATLRANGKGAVTFNNEFTASKAIAEWSPGYLLSLRASAMAGREWAAGNVKGVLPVQMGSSRISSGKAKSFSVKMKDGRTWTIAFSRECKYTISDGRRDNHNEFLVRIESPVKLNLPVGKGASESCMITASDGGVKAEPRNPIAIGAGGTWVRLADSGEIRASSVLDFTRVSQRKAPAGMEGALQTTTNGEFRFSRAQAAPRRFFGCRVPNDVLHMKKQEATAYVKTLARYGYNMIRLQQMHDRLLVSGQKKLDLDDKLCTAVDQFVTDARKEGLYAMTDVMNVGGLRWEDIGLPPNKERPSSGVVGAYFMCNDTAFVNWKNYATLLYGRSNRIGRRTYAEDPSVPLVVGMQGLSTFDCWRDLRKMPDVVKRYGAWLAAKRKEDPDFMKGRVCEPMNLETIPVHEQNAAAFRLFLAEWERDGLARMKGHLASMKSKALIGSCQSSGVYRDVADVRNAGADYMCDCFDLNSAHAMGMDWSAPYRYSDWNLLQTPWPVGAHVGRQSSPGKPVVIFSWSIGEDSLWRSYTGLLVGAWAAKNGWDAMIRGGSPMKDPFTQATDRAIFALFARGDLEPGAPEEAFSFKEDSLTVKTPRTAGGFSMATNGQIKAEPLAVKLSGSPAAVWISSLTDAPITQSKRLLLTHLTERHREGTQFADSRYDLVLRRGTGAWVIRDGTAEIALTAERASSLKVFALSADGVRLGRVPAEMKDGALTFTARVAGPRGAQFLYELVRD